jgi:hypothetical protein
MHQCACGRRKTEYARTCLVCYNEHRLPPKRQCEGCGKTFMRRQRSRDSFLFCSRECYFAVKKARGIEHQQRKENDRVDREIQRELKRAARSVLRTLRWCECGAPLNRPTARYCAPCYQQVIGAGIRNGRRIASQQGVGHVCPNCGNIFRGYSTAVYCSVRCARVIAHHRRYPALRHLPLAERNRLAELVALVRAANRRLWGGEQSHNLQIP